MATDVERLVVAIEAQTRQFERQLNKLEGQVGRSMNRNARAVSALDRSMKSAAASAATFMASFARGAGAAALTALPYTMGRAVSAVADLGNAANRAGVSAEGLQVFRRALEQNGASARDADEAMRRLTRRLGEYANSGAGPAKAAIEGLRLEVFELDGSLRSSEAVLAQIADRFAAIESPAIQAAFAAQLFGDDAGPRLVPALSQGSQALNSFRQELEQTGTLMENDMVQAAVTMEDEYSEMMDTFGIRWQKFAVMTVDGARQILDSIQSVTQGFADAANQAYGAIRTPEQRLRGALGNYDFQSRNGLRTQPQNFFDRSSFRMPTTPGESTTSIVDPRQAQALRELQGQLAATEENTRRVTQAFGHFGTTAEQSARSAGNTLRSVAGEPLDLLSDQIRTANDNVRDFNRTLGDLSQGALGDVNSALSDGKIEWEEWAQIGLSAVERLLGGINRFGGGSGISSFISSIFGGFGGGGGGFNSVAWLQGLPSYDVGTPYVPQDQIARVHKGEAIIPANMNRPGMMGGASVVRVELGEGLEGRLLTQAAGNTIQIVDARTPSIVNQSVAATGGAIKAGQMDAPMGKRFGVSQTAKAR